MVLPSPSPNGSPKRGSRSCRRAERHSCVPSLRHEQPRPPRGTGHVLAVGCFGQPFRAEPPRPDGTGLGSFDDEGDRWSRNAARGLRGPCVRRGGEERSLGDVLRPRPVRFDRRAAGRRTRIRSTAAAGCSRTTASSRTSNASRTNSGPYGALVDGRHRLRALLRARDQAESTAHGTTWGRVWRQRRLGRRTPSVFALNLILTTATECGPCATPTPMTCSSSSVRRSGLHGSRHLSWPAPPAVRVRSADARHAPAVILASERIDDHPAWRPLDSGRATARRRGSGGCTSRIALPDPPAHLLTLADLEPRAAASQRATGPGA